MLRELEDDADVEEEDDEEELVVNGVLVREEEVVEETILEEDVCDDEEKEEAEDCEVDAVLEVAESETRKITAAAAMIITTITMIAATVLAIPSLRMLNNHLATVRGTLF